MNVQAGTGSAVHVSVIEENDGRTLCRPNGHVARSNPTVFHPVDAEATCKSCLKAIAKMDAVALAAAKARAEAQAEQDAANDPLMVLLNNTTPVALSDPDAEVLVSVVGFAPGELDGSLRRRPDGGLVILAGAPEPKSPDQVEREVDDAFAELENLERRRDAVRAVARSNAASIAPVGARVHVALSDAQVARVMATLAEQAAGTTVVFRAFGRNSGPGRVAGRLIPLSKSGQRRPKRSRRG